MTVKALVDDVKRIILKHAKPERIYLYGSRASGEATASSDIDIAYDDSEFKEPWLIEEEVAALPTLVRIDIKNLCGTEERFKNRVISTGRVIYSASKKLRAQDGVYNFKRAFERFGEALDKKTELENEGFGDIVLDLLAKRFEFTYEMSWKAIRRCLDYQGITCNTPRGCFREAYAQALISEESVWLDMIEQRNLSSHVYDEKDVSELLDKVEMYRTAFSTLLDSLERVVTGDVQ